MNAKVYKWCAVPQCTNSSLKTPDKVFVYVPNEKTMRFKWLTLARRDPKAINVDSSIYFCEDHFDLPNDMDNYMEYHIMGSVAKIRMKRGCIPTRFDCQPDRRKRASAETIHRPYITKKQRQDIIQESIKDLEEKSTINKPLELEETSVGSSAVHGDEVIENITQEKDKTANKSIQVYMTHKFRSKAVQSGVKIVNQMTSPLKQDRQSVSTSPFKITRCTSKVKPTTSNIHISSRKIFVDEAQSDSDISYTPSIMDEGTSQTISVQTNSTSDCSELLQDDKQKEAALMLQCTLLKINRNPRCYIGVPKDCHYLLGLIEEYTNIPPVHFLMCLKKIRLNNSFRELADDFSMTPSYASKIFLKNVPLLASVMRAFIVKLDKYNIKNNLPMAFRHKYYHVSCIIDCLEIEIQKPSKAVNQSLSWSEYKKANTIKYLISCTPNGLVNFISPGYGGRVTDTCLVESCDFIKCLQPSMCVMADRGFKHVESYLLKQGVKLVRPPSVVKGSKLSKTEVRETKQIASLRIHIERVIRRLREFSLLKPHACVNHNLVRVLDDSITIACGLINLQDSLIK